VIFECGVRPAPHRRRFNPRPGPRRPGPGQWQVLSESTGGACRWQWRGRGACPVDVPGPAQARAAAVAGPGRAGAGRAGFKLHHRTEKSEVFLKSALFDQLGKWHDVLGFCRAGSAK
jgi:hypothetical protein